MAETWTDANPYWQVMTPYQRAAAMSIMETGDTNDATNVIGAMVNRARADKADLGVQVGTKVYQPSIEPTQEARLNKIIRSQQFLDLSKKAEDYWTGKEDVPHKATHFLAPEATMLSLERGDPQKYKSWRNWTGYDPATGQYQNVAFRDKSHAFITPGEQQPISYTPVEHDPFKQQPGDIVAPGRPKVYINDTLPDVGPPALGDGGQFSPGTLAGNRLAGLNGEERFQTWPERMVRSGTTIAGDTLTGQDVSGIANMGLRREDVTDLPPPSGLTVSAQPGDAIRERAGDMAGLLGLSGIKGTPPGASLGASGSRLAPFYSAAEAAVNAAPMKSAPAADWSGWLKNQQHIKPDEMKWHGIDDFLKARELEGKPITQEELAKHIAENRLQLTEKQYDMDVGQPLNPTDTVGTMYGTDSGYKNLTSPNGKKNSYRESVLHLPQIEEMYSSNHWMERNPILHTRHDEIFQPDPKGPSIGPNGENGYRTLRILELQSDKSAYLRDLKKMYNKEGTGTLNGVEVHELGKVDADGNSYITLSHYFGGDSHDISVPLKDVHAIFGKDADRILKYDPDKIENEYGMNGIHVNWKHVPDDVIAKHDIMQQIALLEKLPYNSTNAWTELGIKHMLKKAADEGFDRLAWEPGIVQHNRYGGRDVLHGTGTGEIHHVSFLLHGDSVSVHYYTDAAHSGNEQSFTLPKAQVSDVFGKEIAEKVNKQKIARTEDDFYRKDTVVPNATINWDKIPISNEHAGLKRLYDEVLPITANKVLKKFGDTQVVKTTHDYGLKSQAGTDYPNTPRKHVDLHTIDLTPKLKEVATQKGFPLFMKGIPFPLEPVDHDPYKHTPVSGDPFQ